MFLNLPFLFVFFSFILTLSCQSSKSSPAPQDLSEDVNKQPYPSTENSRLVSELSDEEKIEYSKIKSQLIGKWGIEPCMPVKEPENSENSSSKFAYQFMDESRVGLYSFAFKDSSCQELIFEKLIVEYKYKVPGVALGKDLFDDKKTYFSYMIDMFPIENTAAESIYTLFYIIDENTLQVATHSVNEDSEETRKKFRANKFDLSSHNNILTKLK